MTDTNVNWRYSGRTDGFFGTGATSAERLLAAGAAGVFTILLILTLRWQGYEAAQGWRFWVLLALVFDVAGGVTANMLNSCKRYYHAPVQQNEHGFAAFSKNSFGFALIHIHPIIAAWAFGGESLHGLVWYGALLVGTGLTLVTPLYLRRPVAASIVIAAIIVNLYWLPLAPGMEWFIPCLFLKIVLAHTVREEPYRPAAIKVSSKLGTEGAL